MTRSLQQIQQDVAAMLLEPHSPSGRPSIYHHNRRANFHKALSLAYPLIERIVGGEFFARQALEYMAVRPSRSGDLHYVGEAFADFLADGVAASGSGYEYLVDLARLEWAWQCALIAADAPSRGTEALAAFAQDAAPELRFRLQPALQVIESRWPVYTLFMEHRREQPALVRLDAGAECACVLRRHAVVEVRRLEPGVAALWRALASGETLDTALSCALQAAPADAFELEPALAELFALGVVADITAKPADA